MARLHAENELGASDAGFSVRVAIFGLGVIIGSLAGGRGGPPRLLKRRFLLGLLTVAVAFAAAGLAPAYATALAVLLVWIGAAIALRGAWDGEADRSAVEPAGPVDLVDERPSPTGVLDGHGHPRHPSVRRP